MGFPRLKDLDIDRNMSSRCQLIASIPEKDFDERVAEIKGKGQELTSKEFLSLAGYLQRERERQERREVALQEAAQVASDERIKVLCGDFREILTEEMVPNGSVSLVLTDLPYEQEYLGALGLPGTTLPASPQGRRNPCSLFGLHPSPRSPLHPEQAPHLLLDGGASQ